MRVLLNYGAKDGTTGAHLHRALERVVDTVAFGSAHESATAPKPDADDCLVWVESGERALPPVDLLTAMPSVGWIIDTHLETSFAPPWRLRLADAFDHAVFAQRPAAEAAASRGSVASWFPLAAPRELCGEGEDLPKREYDVAFVGAAPPGSTRAVLLEEIRKEFRLAPTQGFVQPDRMMDHYRSARVVINPPRKHDLNMRQFEGAGARAVVVTRSVPGLEEAFPSGSYVTVAGDSPAAWLDAVRNALRDESAQTTADAAFETVLKRHTYDHRAAEVIDLLSSSPHRSDTSSRLEALGHAHARYGSVATLRREAGSTAAALAKFRAVELFWRARESAVNLANRAGRLRG